MLRSHTSYHVAFTSKDRKICNKFRGSLYKVMNEAFAAPNVVKVLDVRADLIAMKGCQSSLFCLAQELVQDQDSRRACTK